MKKLFFLFLSFVLLIAPAQAADLPADGQYTIEATLSGGSGRASVESPAALTVENGTATATVVWSSPYYEFMVVDGVTYDPIQEEGNATFAIPVELDVDMAVSAQTIAMSEPHLVDYTLHFDSSTLSQEGAFPVWGIAAAAVVVLAAAVIVLRSRKRGKGA